MVVDGADAGAIERAAALLAAGELVAFPTETVYGLGARADDDAAVAKVFAAKGRPADHPLIVHVATAAEADAFCDKVPDVARRLMNAFWPGPLTVIVPRASGMAAAAAGGQSTVGLRCPSHPVARALLAAAHRQGVPGVAAPSANRFGRVSPTAAAHVASEFNTDLMVLDGGPCEVGIESCIVDCSGGPGRGPVLLRPGVLARAQVEAVAGQKLGERDAASPRASGTLEAHYAPRAKVRLMNEATLRSALEVLGSSPLKLAVYARGVKPASGGIRYRAMPAQARQVAHELFAVLRGFDDEGMQLIWVEEPPAESEWDGVRDRLQRAAAS
jgi:L-threonylcarbamoyladenylate synthase